MCNNLGPSCGVRINLSHTMINNAYYATSEDSDQFAHSPSQIKVFVVHLLD